MSVRIHLAAALICSFAVAASVHAQSQQTGIVRNATTGAPQNSTAEELPAGSMPSGMSGGDQQQYYSTGSGDVAYSSGCADGSCGENCCQPDCGAPNGCSQSCCNSGGGLCCRGGRFFVTADYLYVRANFSETTAFIRQDLQAGTDTFVPLDFGPQSSYRFGGGYRLNRCGEEIRFMFTRMTSDASAVALPGDIVPAGVDAPPEGRTDIFADVDAKAYDIEWAKTIPLGGQCGGCGDSCGGCGDGCAQRCPAWDITWSGGVRIGDVNWARHYTAFDDTNFAVTDLQTAMDFRGAGLRIGLEGRRYFCCDGCISIYGKGNLSLLFGDVDINTVRSSDDGNTVVHQFFTSREIIPVTELEAGMTAQITCHTAITAGYLMSAWHDLGFRNAFDVCDCGDAAVPALLPTHHDDGNILGFDGVFARVEVAF
jgi:hypothetical protein